MSPSFFSKGYIEAAKNIFELVQMGKAEIVREELEDHGSSFKSLLLKMDNANFLLLSEGADQLGTLAVAIPQPEKMIGPSTSSVLLGERNMVTARILAEQLAGLTRKISLVSLYVKSLSERDAGAIMLRLLRKTLKSEEGGTHES